ncbi:MAG: hypothetical protein LUQ39_06540 [Methanomassiliicoccales archaeon]|nr:hypothetical protein [Methanomassiliicoccales archaeon]
MGLSEEEKKEQTRRKRPNYDSRNQLAFDILAEFGTITSHAISEITGGKNEEIIVRTETRNAILASILNIKNRMAPENCNRIILSYITCWPNHIMGLDQRVETTPNGGRWMAITCPWSRATNALCCKTGMFASTATELLTPGYFALNTKRLSRGDGTCEVIIAKNGMDPYQILNEPCIYEPLPPSLDLEEMVLWNHSYMGGMWTLLLKSMLEEFDRDIVMNALTSKFKEIARDFSKRIIREYGISIEDLDSVVEGFDSFHSGFLKKSRHKRTTDGFTITTDECPYSGEPYEVCVLFQSFYDGLIAEIDSEVTMKCSSSMTKGDKTCHWAIRKKEEAKGQKSKEEPSQDNPIKRLTNKFIDGEITEEEFRKKLSVLKELKL